MPGVDETLTTAGASVVIAAHNEERVVSRCLSSLQTNKRKIDITVVPNGCDDQTATVARRHEVRVIETATPSKALALNLGDADARGFPRVYLDADIVIPPGGLDRLAEAFLADTPPLVAVPSRRLVLAGRSLLVRAYFAINQRLPTFETGLFGRGVIALSAEGRARFGTFPQMVADDLFLDSLFTEAERTVVNDVVVDVATPLRTRDLVRRLVRVRRGNAQMRRAGASGDLPLLVRPADRWAWLCHVVLPHPWLAPAGVAYVCITLIAAVRAKFSLDQRSWGHDASSRAVAEPRQ